MGEAELSLSGEDHETALEKIKLISTVVTFIFIAIGIVGNILSLVVLTRPKMKVEYNCPSPPSNQRESRDFFWNFTSRSRSRGISISLSLLEKSETKNHFTFHFLKRVKGIFVSLFISQKKVKALQISLYFSRKKSEIVDVTLDFVIKNSKELVIRNIKM